MWGHRVPTRLCCRWVQISCACRRWAFRLSQWRRHPAREQQAQEPAVLPQGFPEGEPSGASLPGSARQLQVSHAGSARGELPRPQASVPSTQPSWWAACSPVVALRQGGKFSSNLGPWKLVLRFLSFWKKKYMHTWIFCGLNVFITLLIARRVVLTGSVLWHGRGSFCHSDKSSVVPKPLEVSLPRKEICLLLGGVEEHK